MAGEGLVLAAVSDVTVLRDVLVPMRDGVELAADFFLPRGEGPFPVIVGYHPYRKDDYSGGPDTKMRYLIAEGYGGAQIDIRGTGSSRGSTKQMRRQQEWEDGYDLVEWIAAQPWCDGNIGMTGESYGGLSSLLVAAEQPPHLKAIVPIYASDDFYLSIHPGGNPSMVPRPIYGSMMLAINALPPLADNDGRWLDAWEHKLEHNEPWLSPILRNPRDGSFWDSSSIRGNRIKDIRCPTYVIGGWHDVYITEPFRVFMGIDPGVPSKLLMGPYMHLSPWTGVPGPQVHHMHEMVRWFDQFLKGEETGITDEPPIRLFVREHDAPAVRRDIDSGSWRYESEWPPARAQSVSYVLGAEGVLDPNSDSDGGDDSLRYDPSAGLTTLGLITGFAKDVGLPLDQRAEEPKSLVYTTAPLTEDVELGGFPTAVLHVSSTAVEATFVARLCDVAPDGSSLLVSKGILNATHRDSHESPQRLEPGSVYELEFQLDAVSYVFAAGHRIRLLVASSDFPFVWPTPYAAVNTVYHGADTRSRIELPVVGEQSPRLPAPVFAELPVFPPGFDPAEPPRWLVVHDLIDESVEMTMVFEEVIDVGEGTQLTNSFMGAARTSLVDPADASVQTSLTADLVNPTLVTRSHAQTTIRASQDVFHTTTSLEVDVDGKPHFQRSWTETTPRHLT